MSGNDVIKIIVDHIKPKNRKKVAIGVMASGNGSNLQALIDNSVRPESHFAITSVVVNTPGSRALERADRVGIPNYLVDHNTFTNKRGFEERIYGCLVENSVELVVLAGFLRVLTPYFLGQFVNQIINLHPSLLPRHKGLNAIEKALLARDNEAGCTVHLVDAGLDTGPMIAQSICPILKDDDLPALRYRIQQLEHQLLPSVVNTIAKMVITRDCA